MKKIYILFATILISAFVLAQNNNHVSLKWKLKPNEVLTYKTALEEIDTANFKSTTFNFGSFIKALSDSSGKKDKEANELLSEFNKEFKNFTMISILTEQRKGIIDIALSMDVKDTKTDTIADSASRQSKEIHNYLQELYKGVLLRGAVNENGTIESFYLKNEQRNLVALFYELPDRPIKAGDSWSLDVHFLSMDQNFKCDTSYRKNRVNLMQLKKEGNETIAVMNYDIEEYVSGDFSSPKILPGGDKTVKTMMRMTYNGIAEFSVEEGRWKSFVGVMSLTSSGIMNSHTTKRVCLLPQ